MKKFIILFIVITLTITTLTACSNNKSETPKDITSDSSETTGMPNNGKDTEATGNSEEGTAANKIKTLLQNAEPPVVNEELVELFFNYQIETGPFQSYEWRLLPSFDVGKAPDWDQLTLFVFMLSNKVERDSDGTYTLTTKAFGETVDRFFTDFEYTHRDSDFLHFLGDTYTPTGWDVHGSTYFRLNKLFKTGEDTYTASFDGFEFWELDDFDQPYNEVSKNMKAIIDYIGERKTEVKRNDTILEIFKKENYAEILKKTEQLEFSFKLSSDPKYAFKYLFCKRIIVE